MRTLERPDRLLDTIRWVLYFLSAAVLVIGLYGAVSLFTMGISLETIMGLMGVTVTPALTGLISASLKQAATVLGTVVLGLTLILAGLFYSSGKLLARTIILEMRVRRLEFAITEHAKIGHVPAEGPKP